MWPCGRDQRGGGSRAHVAGSGEDEAKGRILLTKLLVLGVEASTFSLCFFVLIPVIVLVVSVLLQLLLMLVVDVLQLQLVLVGGGLQRCVEILDIVPVGNADIGEHCKCAATLPLKYSLPKMVCA